MNQDVYKVNRSFLLWAPDCTVNFISLRTPRKRERGPCPIHLHWARATLTLPWCSKWDEINSKQYLNTETDSHTLKGVVRRFGFSLSWLPGGEHGKTRVRRSVAIFIISIDNHKREFIYAISQSSWALEEDALSIASYTTNGEETQSAQT